MAVSAAAESQHQPLHPLREFWIYFRANRGALAGMVVILAVCLQYTSFAVYVLPGH